MNSHFRELKLLIEAVKSVGLDDDPWIVNGLRSLSYRWNPRLYSKIQQAYLDSLDGGLLDRTWSIPMSTEDKQAVDGPYKIGTIAGTGIDFGFTKLHINRHCLIAGDSGTGKSTLIKILASQLVQDKGVRLLIIDPKEGGDYRFLAKMTDNIAILRPDQLKLNPFTSIPNVPLAVLREALIEVISVVFKVLDAGEGIIAKHVDKVFSEYQQPTFYDFARSIRSEKTRYSGRKQGYLDSIETRLLKILISLADILDCKADYFDKLADCHLVIEAGELSGGMQRTVVNWVMMKELLYSIKNMDRDIFRFNIFDESQGNIFPKQQGRLRTPYMATLVTQARAFNVGLLALAQNPSLIMPELTSNSCIKLCYHLGGEEIVCMARHMGLTYDQVSEMYTLGMKEAVCRLGVGYMEPVKLEIYDFQDEPMSNDELAEIMKPKWDELLEGIEPAKQLQLSGKSTSNRKSEKHSGRSHAGVSGKTRLDSKVGELSVNEGAYLRMVSRHPWRTPMEVYARLNDEKIMGNETMSQATSVKTRKGLIRKGYLESFDVLGTGKSGKSQCDIVTEKVRKVYKPRGGNLHGFWCYRVGEYFERQGEKVILGDTLTGAEIDLSAGKLGIEIVVNTLVIENLERHLKLFEEILILCIDKKKKREIEKQIGNLILKPIRVELLKDYFIPL